jgi:hypothetical protein
MAQPPSGKIAEKIVRVVNAYGSSISCADVNVGPENIATLVPLDRGRSARKATYAVLWDLKYCLDGVPGGSGTPTGSQEIAIVTVGDGNRFMIDTDKSYPAVTFDNGIHSRANVGKLVQNTETSIVVEGFEYGKEDAMCCPSVPVRVTLRADDKGNWAPSEKTVLTSRK